MFGKYRIISALGAGSSGAVYLAKHLKLDVYRAIKCIPKDTAHCKNAADNSFIFSEGALLAEADLLKTLSHPGIPLIYDIDEDNDFVYMIEEFIQGESLENFILHQNYISQELIIEYGIQLCDILDYLHHITPYPILYLDLKPEHIILCGNQVKLIDFGIASFLIGSDRHYQHYGTDGFAAPEACLGQAVGTAADIYGLGKVLCFMADAAKPPCSEELLRVISKAASDFEAERYQTASELKASLFHLRELHLSSCNHQHFMCQASSRPITRVAVLGSRPGAGATHFAVSFVSVLNHKKQKSIYLPADHSNILSAMAESHVFWKEKEGIFHYQDFSGIPDYGDALEVPLPDDAILVRDYGTCVEEFFNDPQADLVFLVMSGSLWDIPDCIRFARQLQAQENVYFICNYDNKKAAKTYARQLKKPVYCFPLDCSPFQSTRKKERLLIHILRRKEVKRHFWHWRKRDKTSLDHRHRRLRFRRRRYTSCHRTGKFLRL